MNGTVDVGGMINRMIRAAMLDAQLYEEVEHDETKTQEALLVVLLVAVVNGVLSLPMNLILGRGFLTSLFGLVFGLVWTVIAYFIYAYLAFFIGTSLFGGTADFGELRRVLGYAYTPSIVTWIPCVGFIVAAIWTFVAGVVAIRQALDVDTTRAVLTALISVAVIFIIAMILGGILGVGMAGVSTLSR